MTPTRSIFEASRPCVKQRITLIGKKERVRCSFAMIEEVVGISRAQCNSQTKAALLSG
jgi:hypothetical protein